MIIPAQAIGSSIQAQTVIVGAGPAGMSLALDLADRGVDVALLSSGSLAPDRLSQDLSKAESFPDYHADPRSLDARRLGGLSWAWGGRCLPLQPLDFVPRAELDLPGWPIEYADLMQHGETAAKFLGIGHPDFEPRAQLENADLSLERWASMPALANKHKKVLAADDGPKVYLDITCSGAEIDEHGKVIAIQAKTPDGKPVRVKGSDFVLAAGGLETARLLLWFSEQNGRTAPRWTGRGYMGHLKAQIADIRAPDDIVGTLDYRQGVDCFVRNRLALPEQTLVDRRLPNIQFWLDNPTMSNPGHGVPGLSLAYLALATPVVGPRLLPSAMRDYFVGFGKPSMAAHMKNVLRSPFGAARYCLASWSSRRTIPVRPGYITRKSDGFHRLTCAAEERPRFQNGLTLGTSRDQNGMPRSIIKRDLHPDDINGLINANRALIEACASKSIHMRLDGQNSKLEEKVRISSGDGYHQIGTARMGLSKNDSVTDPECRVHGISNLFVAGSSVFPRCGQANPTFSIVCLSHRLAGTIAKGYSYAD